MPWRSAVSNRRLNECHLPPLREVSRLDGLTQITTASNGEVISSAISKDQESVAIIGAGPAGLTAAYLLARGGKKVAVFEADPTYVGGISRTVQYHGFSFDIGGHRFFSKSREVEDFWTEMLPHDMLERPRSSRIYYRREFFAYPLKAAQALWQLGIFESIRCMLSYAKARVFPIRNPTNFQDWVSNQFGSRLFHIFFKTYTEKVWGMDCREISADWAAQRIKGLSMTSLIVSALKPKFGSSRKKKGTIKTLINSFRYPRKGPGMMWDACAARFVEFGGALRMDTRVTQCHYDAATRRWTLNLLSGDGTRSEHSATSLISSTPMRQLVAALSPAMSPAAQNAAEKLRYRDFLTVALMLKDRNIFDDNWIYVHEPEVKVGRIQNFKSWSPEMVPDPALTCLGLEYFCFEGDGLWNSSDADLIALAKKELAQLGLANEEDILDGCVVRQPKAYPVYDDDYEAHVATIREELERSFPSLHLVGRNGMHKYNNQDHSMMTAMLTAQNILAGDKHYDVWEVNEDAEYHEQGKSGASTSGLRQVPRTVTHSG